MSEILHFLPWSRSGLGLELSDREPVSLPATAPTGTLTAWITLDGVDSQTTLTLRPPDHAMGIDASQIVRRYPSPMTPDSEYGYFPHIEFTAPDLPWLLSPSVADEGASETGSTGRLRPWLVLVCTEAAEATLSATSNRTGQTLSVSESALPDLTESWAWAHVQSVVPAREITEAALSSEGLIVSRLVCPRRLEPHKRYRAAVVNAWSRTEAGLVPSWDKGSSTVALDVFDTWTFTTGEVGSFEELCERLGPIQDNDISFGLHPMDLSDLGLANPWLTEEPVRTSFGGAMVDSDAEPLELEIGDANAYVNTVVALIDQGTHRRMLAANAPDPVVTPPNYGSFAIKANGAVQSGFMAELNFQPRRRAAAGLGADIVRLHQERFMTTAWEQVGALAEANRLVGLSHLRRAIGTSWKRRVRELDPQQSLSVLWPQMSFARTNSDAPVKTALATSSVPNATVRNAMQRMLRPAGVVTRSFKAPLNRGDIPGRENIYSVRADMARDLRDALATGPARAGLGLQLPQKPGGTIGNDPRRAQAQTGSTLQPIRPTDPTRIIVTGQLDLQETQEDALNSLRLGQVARLQTQLRVPVLNERFSEFTDDEFMPTRITSGPVFKEPLSVSLLELSPQLLMPGVEEFPENSVRLVEADPAFVAAFLAGANHEMIRELLWREYPASMTHTAFQRFWARPDPADVDIDPIDLWQYILPLSKLGAAGGESTVLLVRGDLLRQYPSTRFLLLAPGESVPLSPAFNGRLPPDVGFFGFDVQSADAVTAPDSEWVVIIEEPAQEPRFGLDTSTSDPQPTTYSELAWDHLSDPETLHLTVSDEDFDENLKLLQEATWGLNGAHMAFATYQQPFRRLFRAVDLLGGDDA